MNTINIHQGYFIEIYFFTIINTILFASFFSQYYFTGLINLFSKIENNYYYTVFLKTQKITKAEIMLHAIGIFCTSMSIFRSLDLFGLYDFYPKIVINLFSYVNSSILFAGLRSAILEKTKHYFSENKISTLTIYFIPITNVFSILILSFSIILPFIIEFSENNIASVSLTLYISLYTFASIIYIIELGFNVYHTKKNLDSFYSDKNSNNYIKANRSWKKLFKIYLVCVLVTIIFLIYILYDIFCGIKIHLDNEDVSYYKFKFPILWLQEFVLIIILYFSWIINFGINNTEPKSILTGSLHSVVELYQNTFIPSISEN